MRHLMTATHQDVLNNKGDMFTRHASRAIVLKGDDILLLYTARYDDYTLPGGGVDQGENVADGLLRELAEETGANDIEIIDDFGIYEEYRPWHKPDFDTIHMLSYCYVCRIGDNLGETSYEDYELGNGMKPVWINIYQAIKHNQEIIKHSDKKGMSIERETFLLKKVVEELL
ncbi:NUDIX domain-containing protein [Vibrio sp. SS-MA-C1-2]|uniref:NUDIX hydrolase n=1 Tax=Vibrio sp. SS-MA-C1-2 TaxID=2908646 RepID=UPI001F2A0164|nr:NUDIX hydrolase [Vibrio sp. SS-MA-C1-2]UJF17662.1 NUDIX domain-containing protein [Vibrio sp. SS-MA-C1-2]